MKRLLALLAGLTVLTGCTGSPSEDSTTPPVSSASAGAASSSSAEPAESAESAEAAQDQAHPDVLEAELTGQQDGQFMIAVTISSPYDSPDRYADGWRVMTPDGEVLAEHELAHDHANEQPFTRTRGPFEIPEDVTGVVVEGHDQENGYGGETVTVEVPR